MGRAARMKRERREARSEQRKELTGAPRKRRGWGTAELELRVPGKFQIDVDGAVYELLPGGQRRKASPTAAKAVRQELAARREYSRLRNVAMRRRWSVPTDEALKRHGPAAWLRYWQAMERYEAGETEGRPVAPHMPGGGLVAAASPDDVAKFGRAP